MTIGLQYALCGNHGWRLRNSPLAGAHFPGDTYGQRVICADGLKIANLMDAILPLFVLDELC